MMMDDWLREATARVDEDESLQGDHVRFILN